MKSDSTQDCGLALYEGYATTDPRIVERISMPINTSALISAESTGTHGRTSTQSSSAQNRSFDSESSSISTTSNDSTSNGGPLREGCSSPRRSHCTKGFPKKSLVLCVNTGRFHNTLGQIDVSNICRDNQTFSMIKDRSLEVQGFRARARRLFLFRPNKRALCQGTFVY